SATRRKLIQAIRMCRAGDTLVVWSIDRLARRAADALRVIDLVRKRGANVRVIGQADLGMDSSTKEGRLQLGILACMAEFEFEQTQARIRAGKQAGRHLDYRQPKKDQTRRLSREFNERT